VWIVCAYYTNDSIYSKHVKKLEESLRKWNLPHDIQSIESLNDWHKGMQYKPYFLRDMLRKHPTHSIVYVDVDSIFCRYPSLFDTLHSKMSEPIAVHYLDHSKYRRKHLGPELLSGTIFLRNMEETSIIIREWIFELSKNPKLWDQRGLATVLKNHPHYKLPEEYCVIFDYMSTVKNPVIKHFQASRVFRGGNGKTKLRKERRVRVVDNNRRMIKLSRAYN